MHQKLKLGELEIQRDLCNHNRLNQVKKSLLALNNCVGKPFAILVKSANLIDFIDHESFKSESRHVIKGTLKHNASIFD